MTKKDIAEIAKAINDYDEGSKMIEKGKQLIAKSEIGFVEHAVHGDKPVLVCVLYRRKLYRIKAERIVGLIK